jgi:hypothetical protein
MVKRTRHSEADARAEADRKYLEQVRGTQDGGAAQQIHGGGALPTPTGPERLSPHTEVVTRVATAAPSPVLGVSPILGQHAETSPPPVGSFTTPPVGPPAAAFATQAFAPVREPDAPSRPSQFQNAPAPNGSGVRLRQDPVAVPAGTGMAPGALRKSGAHSAPSVVEQNPFGTLPPPEPMGPAIGAGVPSPQQFSSAEPYRSAPQPFSSQGSDLPLLLGPNVGARPADLVTCPECGEMATVDAARRKSEDFCRKCDFPLFWARTTVILPSGEETGASLRRLPGTVGRAATAALLCPHCGEPNSPAAENCIRCTLSLHPVELPPEPVYIPAPEPERVPVVIGREYPLWWILLVTATVLTITLMVVWVVVNSGQ